MDQVKTEVETGWMFDPFFVGKFTNKTRVKNSPEIHPKFTWQKSKIHPKFTQVFTWVFAGVFTLAKTKIHQALSVK